ncbi:MAG: translation initiation factor IF-2, partial [Microgenomates group bacterium]
IVAINKVDLPEANPEKVKNDLLKYDVLVEGKGGTIPTVLLSAKTGQGVNELLESILLLASELNLNYSPNNPPKAYIIETKKDKRGIVVSAIIKDGILKVGDDVYADNEKAKIRAIITDQGLMINEVAPSTPFELLGFKQMPEVGVLLQTQPIRKKEDFNITFPSQKKIDTKKLFSSTPKAQKLSLIIKADTLGSLEAITSLLGKNNQIETILKAVGEVNKSDVFLAKTTKSIIIGFAVNLPTEVINLAKQEKVIIKTYNIIYELEEELFEAAKLLQEKQQKEKNLKGEAKVLATFIIEKEHVFGVEVTKGKINLGDEVEIYREGKFIGKTKLVSLKIRAKRVVEVKKSQEAGMIFSPFLDIMVGDVVKSIL